MKGTQADGTINRLFEGEMEKVIKCTKIKYESVTKELLKVLQLPLQESNTIEGALKNML